jgi:Secretion system C-terminal sorting domain
VAVYPNPNNGQFRIRMNSDLYNNLNIRIYNAMGQMVKTQVSTGLTYGSVVNIDLGTLPSGTYHLFLSNDQNGFVKRSSSFVVYK